MIVAVARETETLRVATRPATERWSHYFAIVCYRLDKS